MTVTPTDLVEERGEAEALPPLFRVHVHGLEPLEDSGLERVDHLLHRRPLISQQTFAQHNGWSEVNMA